jgi:hypothetical protein
MAPATSTRKGQERGSEHFIVLQSVQCMKRVAHTFSNLDKIACTHTIWPWLFANSLLHSYSSACDGELVCPKFYTHVVSHRSRHVRFFDRSHCQRIEHYPKTSALLLIPIELLQRMCPSDTSQPKSLPSSSVFLSFFAELAFRFSYCLQNSQRREPAMMCKAVMCIAS